MTKTNDIVGAYMALRNAASSTETAKTSLMFSAVAGKDIDPGPLLFAIETAERHLANARAALQQGGGDHA